MKIVRDPWLEPDVICALAGEVRHGKGIVPVMTSPPCFLDVASGRLVYFPEKALELAMKPRQDPPWLLPSWPVRPEEPDAIRVPIAFRYGGA